MELLVILLFDKSRYISITRGLPMSSTVKREKEIGEKAWGAAGSWKVFWDA
jgi:hypothetical protein